MIRKILNFSAIFSLTLSFTTAFVQADPWNGANNPANMSPSYHYDFDSLPLEGRVEDKQMPWSDNYWESDWGGISLRWNTYTAEQLDPMEIAFLDKYTTNTYTPPTQNEVKGMSKEDLKKLSPAEKYDILMGRYDFPTVKAERARTSPDMKDWEGICHGWTVAAINHGEPNANEAINPDGVVVPFGSSDLKGLMSYYYGVPAYEYARGNRKLRKLNGVAQFNDQVDSGEPEAWTPVPENMLSRIFMGGWSFNTSMMKEGEVDDVNMEAFNLVGQIGNRPERGHGFLAGTKNMEDPNAGAFHVVMANQLGLMKHGFVGNINKRLKNAEIWNQPIVGFRSEILKDKRRRNGEGSVKIHTQLTYVSEIPQQWEPVVGTDKQRFDTYDFEYTLELQGGQIVGGSWEKRKVHPSFAWKHDKLPIKGYFYKLNQIYQSRF